MLLTVKAIQNAKAKDKQYKLNDGAGLYLLVTPTGSKCWRYKYYWAGKEKVLSLGMFQDVSLSEARERRDEARKVKNRGIDPSDIKREQKQQILESHEHNFASIAREWHEQKSSRWSPYYSRQVMQRLENDILPKIGNLPIAKITAPDILRIARAIEARDAIEIAHRAVTVCSQIFQYAMILGRTKDNPALALRGALKTAERKHRPHLSHSELPDFFRTLDAYDGGVQTKLAIRLLILTFVRPSELRCARWSEIDFKRKEWRIPLERMKMRIPHIVPLSCQAIEILKTLKNLNGGWEYVFPSIQAPRKCMSSNAMLFALWTMGYKGKATVHGFRGTASTILNESGLFGRDVIERQLSHQERSRVRAAYDHAEHLPARQKMMQWWADCLDEAAKSSKKKTVRLVAQK
jgi:integrase